MSWKTLQLYLGLAVFAIVAIQTGLSIMCWECNSEYDRRCADPFQNNSFAPTDCNQKFLLHYPGKKAIACRKIIQRIKGTERYIRTCGYLEEDRSSHDCFRRAGTFDVQMEYCQCTKDHCNGASNTQSHVIITVSILAVFAYKYLKYDINV